MAVSTRRELEILAEMGHRPSAFVLRWGREGRATALPPCVRPGPMGECYANAGRLAGLHGLTYCEGWATREGLPISVPHAWLMDREGRFVDPTWPEVGGDYVGVPFRFEYLMRTVARTEHWGLLGFEPPPEDPEEFLWTPG